MGASAVAGAAASVHVTRLFCLSRSWGTDTVALVSAALVRGRGDVGPEGLVEGQCAQVGTAAPGPSQTSSNTSFCLRRRGPRPGQGLLAPWSPSGWGTWCGRVVALGAALLSSRHCHPVLSEPPPELGSQSQPESRPPPPQPAQLSPCPSLLRRPHAEVPCVILLST